MPKLYHLYFSDSSEICFVDEEMAKVICDKVVGFCKENGALACAGKNDGDFLGGYDYYVCWYKGKMIFES